MSVGTTNTVTLLPSPTGGSSIRSNTLDCLVEPFELGGEVLHGLWPVVGVNNEVLALRDLPRSRTGRRPSSKKNAKNECY